jgi:hypothetical protein
VGIEEVEAIGEPINVETTFRLGVGPLGLMASSIVVETSLIGLLIGLVLLIRIDGSIGGLGRNAIA